MVREIWESVYEEVDSMRHWQAKIRRLRQHLRGWEKTLVGQRRRKTGSLTNSICWTKRRR
jgi:hypothetical protein